MDWGSLEVLAASPRLAALGHFDLMGWVKPDREKSREKDEGACSSVG